MNATIQTRNAPAHRFTSQQITLRIGHVPLHQSSTLLQATLTKAAPVACFGPGSPWRFLGYSGSHLPGRAAGEESGKANARAKDQCPNNAPPFPLAPPTLHEGCKLKEQCDLSDQRYLECQDQMRCIEWRVELLQLSIHCKVETEMINQQMT